MPGWLAGCVFPGRGGRHVVTVCVEQAHCHRPHHRSGSRVDVQSRRFSTLAGTCFVAPRHRTVAYRCISPSRKCGTQARRRLTAAGVLMRPSPSRSCAYVTRGYMWALTCRRRHDHIREVLGLRQCPCDIQQPVLPPHSKVHACARTHSQTRTSTHAHSRTHTHTHAHARTHV